MIFILIDSVITRHTVAMALWSFYFVPISPLSRLCYYLPRWYRAGIISSTHPGDVYIEGEMLQRRKYRGMKWQYKKSNLLKIKCIILIRYENQVKPRPTLRRPTFWKDPLGPDLARGLPVEYLGSKLFFSLVIHVKNDMHSLF